VLLCQLRGANLLEGDLLAVHLRVVHARDEKLGLYLSHLYHLGLYLIKMDPLALNGMGKTTVVPITLCSPSSMTSGWRSLRPGPGDSEALATSFRLPSPKVLCALRLARCQI